MITVLSPKLQEFINKHRPKNATLNYFQIRLTLKEVRKTYPNVVLSHDNEFVYQGLATRAHGPYTYKVAIQNIVYKDKLEKSTILYEPHAICVEHSKGALNLPIMVNLERVIEDAVKKVLSRQTVLVPHLIVTEIHYDLS
jgi:hypothetical protein